LIAILFMTSAAEAICKPGLVRRDGSFIPVSWIPRGSYLPSGPSGRLALAEKKVRLRYLGHSSFLITGPRGARVLTDPYITVAKPVPEAVTVSNFHETHSQTGPYEDKTQILFGVTSGGKPLAYEKTVRAIRLMSFPQFAEGTDTPFVENTIFIFQVAGVCIAHFGNARLGPSEAQFRALGKIHVVLIPIDGSFTVPHQIAARIVKRIGANVVIPMHYFGPELLGEFYAALKAEGITRIERPKSPEVSFSLRRLPPPTTYMVLTPAEDVP
jgi:L-ascorbate metabolism protein UlaG (beta-lactamase superfamily)